MSYYYCCSLPLAAGSVVNPGNWGRMIRLYSPGLNSNAWVLARELAYEQVRRVHYAAAPSRFDCLFLCFTDADAKEFRSIGRPFDLIYEVDLINPQAASHVGDWTLPNITNQDNVTIFEARAQLYWQGQNVAKQEYLTLSPITIVRLVP